MIRPYHSDDKPQLLTLLNLNVPRYFECSEVADFSYYLDNHVETYFVIEEAKHIVGCAGSITFRRKLRLEFRGI